MTITVTAENGSVSNYTLNVNVAGSADTSLSSVTVNGSVFSIGADGNSEFAAVYGTTQVAVSAVSTDSNALVAISGNTGLTSGSNPVTVAVTAENGDVKNYVFKVVVASPNANTDLSSFKVNGTDVTDSSTIDLAYGTLGVTVDAATSADTSTYEVSGSGSLHTGDNTLTVSVTAQSGAVTAHSVTLRVASPSSDKSIQQCDCEWSSG